MDETPAPRVPRRSWTRLRLRTLMLLPVGIALLLLLVDRSMHVFWVGRRNVSFRWLIVDATTGRPIGQALIEIFDQDGDHQVPLKTLTTNGHGQVEVVERCTASGTGSPLRRTGHVRLPFWDFRVSRSGYKTSTLTSLPEQTGTWALDIQKPELAPMKVELHPDASDR